MSSVPHSSRQDSRTCPAIHQHGITILHTPATPCIADIVFVHGLGGHPYETWHYRNSREENSTSRTSGSRSASWRTSLAVLRGRNKATAGSSAAQTAAGSLSQSHDSSTDDSHRTRVDCYWPFDLLPLHNRDIRTMTYGYDSHPSHFYRGRTVQMNITQHAQQLLQSVSDARVLCRQRPLFFVCHSLGGILVKDALLQSAKYEYQPALRDLSSSCSAIFFFGTPHQGANAAAYGELIARIVGTLPLFPSVYRGVLRELRPDGEKLSNVSADFNDVLNKNIHPSEKIQVYSFQEGKGLLNVNGLDEKVVPDASSCLQRRDIEQRSFVMKNHMNMCKIESASEPTFSSFQAALTGYTESLRARQRAQEGQVSAPRPAAPQNVSQPRPGRLDLTEPMISLNNTNYSAPATGKAIMIACTSLRLRKMRLTNESISTRSKLRNEHFEVDKLKAKLFVAKKLLRRKELGIPRLVCSDPSCVEFKDDGSGDGMLLVHYPHPCDTECYLEGVTIDTRGHPDVRHSAAFRGHETCRMCGHHFSLHMQILYELESYIVDVKDHGIARLIDHRTESKGSLQASLETNDRLIVEVNTEQERFDQALTKLGSWMKNQSRSEDEDFVLDHLHALVNAETAARPQRQDDLTALEDIRETYRRNLTNELWRASKHEVESAICSLLQLQHEGQSLEQRLRMAQIMR